MPTIPTYPPIFYEIAFGTPPNQSANPPYWSDVTVRTQFPWSSTHGRQYELDTNPTGEWRTSLDNRDGALDPANTSSVFAPGVVPYRGVRVRVQPGPNLLTPDQATGGDVSGFSPGPVPAALRASADTSFTLTLVAPASPYQGLNVFQAVVPNGSASGLDVLDLAQISATPGSAYSAQAQVRIQTGGQNLATRVAINWLSPTGTVVSTTSGSTSTITGGSATWIQLTASGTAPTGATGAVLRVVTAATPSAQTTYQVDGCQFEQSATVTPFQVPLAASVNLLPQNIATGGTSIAATDTAANWWYPSKGSVSVATGLTAAPSGQTSALAWVTPSATTSTSPLLAGPAAPGPVADCVQVTAGSAYTASLYGQRAASADATIAVTLSVAWYNALGTLLSTSTGSPVTLAAGTWNRLTATGTAPASAVWGRPQVAITTPASTTVSNTVYLAAWQFEQAGSASAWVDPGQTYQIHNGLIERWPQSWGLEGTYGTADVIAVDALAALAQYTLQAPFYNEVLAMGPNFFYTLSDPAGSSSCADLAGKRASAPVENSPFGAGSLALGSSVTASSQPSGLFTGTAGPVAHFANTTGASGQNPQTFINLAKTTATPGPPSSGSWTRMIHFRAPTAPGTSNLTALWATRPPTWLSGNNSSFFIGISDPANLEIDLSNAAGGSTGSFSYLGGSMCDGNWHQVVVVVDASGTGGTYARAYVDGALVTSPGSSGATGPLYLSSVASDAIGCEIQQGTNGYFYGFAGDVALAAELPVAVTAAQITNLYQSWRNASSGESTGSRYQRVVSWTGYTGATSIDAGVTQQMGPATDLTGATALDALNAIALTENGNSYVSSGGVLTFKQRSDRYNKPVPQFVFGENQTAGEWPYESLTSDYDPSRLFNTVQVTQYATGQTATAIDRTSQASYFPRIIQRTINVLNYSEAGDAASYLLQQYRNPRTRVASITLHPSAQPGLFLTCLRLEIGTRIRVMRRPPGVPVQQIDCFVESIAWDIDPNTGEAFVHLQCSPADLASYWVLGAMHTTLNAQATAGAGSITINALPDAATNRLASSMPQTQQLTLEPGTVRAETVTVVPPLPSTSPGYATAVLNVTPALLYTHPANSIVCEPLPAGVTDPTTYDAQSVLAALSTTVAATVTAGGNTITIKALSDAQRNAFISDAPQSQVLWLSPGTPNFEAVTVLATGVPVTFPGYTQITLTLTASLTKPHATGDIVCEPLPGGYTNPVQIGATTRVAY